MSYSTREERQKFYMSKEWFLLRLYKLSLNPFCEKCAEKKITKSAREIHHIIDLEQDETLALEIKNLQSLCHECHTSITMIRANEKKKKNPGHVKRLFNI